MNRTARLQDRRMQKFRDVLSAGSARSCRRWRRVRFSEFRNGGSGAIGWLNLSIAPAWNGHSSLSARLIMTNSTTNPNVAAICLPADRLAAAIVSPGEGSVEHQQS
jgi:hypothetical protein